LPFSFVLTFFPSNWIQHATIGNPPNNQANQTDEMKQVNPITRSTRMQFRSNVTFILQAGEEDGDGLGRLTSLCQNVILCMTQSGDPFENIRI
jgi:hypothetical protein